MSTSESQTKASLKYAKENLKRIPLDVKKDEYEKYKTIAESSGMSVRGFIIEAIEEKIERIKKDIEK